MQRVGKGKIICIEQVSVKMNSDVHRAVVRSAAGAGSTAAVGLPAAATVTTIAVQESALVTGLTVASGELVVGALLIGGLAVVTVGSVVIGVYAFNATKKEFSHDALQFHYRDESGEMLCITIEIGGDQR